MKTGYTQAAWRLLDTGFGGSRVLPGPPTWAVTELAGTPFQPTHVVAPIVRPKGSH